MRWDQLRPHQQKAVSLLRKEWKEKRTHLLYAPCAFGKTAFASYLSGAFLDQGMRTLFIAPYTVLVEQTAKRFMEYGLPQPGIIWRDHPDHDPDALVQIASADTLLRREWPENIDLVIVDEAHIRRKTFLEIMDNIDTPVIGLSGTPFTKWLGTHYQSLVKPCTMRELIDQKYLSDYEFYAPSRPNMKGCKTSNTSEFGYDYQASAAAEVMGDYKIVGDIVENWIDNGENRPTIAFACNVAHANQLCIEFNRVGVQAEVMTAKTPHHERKAIIQRFEDGITKIICNVGVLVAGFDSDVRCIIYARPTKSEIRWIQCLARGLRAADGKSHCLIFDHSGSVFDLGYPDSIEYDELLSSQDGMDEVKKAREEKEKQEKLPKECPQCHYMKPAGQYVCAKCGYKPIAGEDVEADTSRGLEKLDGKKKVYSQEDKQQFFSELTGMMKERAALGKKPLSSGWRSHKYKAKFGVWPKNMMEIPKVPSPDTRKWIQYMNIKFAKGRAKYG